MYSTFVHLLMMQDSRRMDAYGRAIRAVVRPGDVVLDVGCGAGILSFLAEPCARFSRQFPTMEGALVRDRTIVRRHR